ncbi:MAG: methyltransferase domain-containing protein [Luteimonas sp.]
MKTNDIEIEAMKDKALAFDTALSATKASLSSTDFPWYPYGTLNNLIHLDALLTGTNRQLLKLIGDRATLDIGCADGDLALFLETLGCEVQVVDYAPTNYNSLRGFKLLKEFFSSSVELNELDLDAQFALPEKSYGLVFLLGILYHLKNPFFVLESLAKVTEYCLISTRIAKFDSEISQLKERVDFSHIPAAYLLDDLEANGDSSNYWIFTDAGLRRILKRTGWEILDYKLIGNTLNSDPASVGGDERAFCLVRSSRFRV